MPESSGTGASETDKIVVTCDNGKQRTVWIDIWCLPIECIAREFKRGLREAGFTLKNIENLKEAFEMYVENVGVNACCWTKKQILEANEERCY